MKICHPLWWEKRKITEKTYGWPSVTKKNLCFKKRKQGNLKVKIKSALLFALVITTLTIFFSCSSSDYDFLRDVKVELGYEDFEGQPHYSGSVEIRVGGKLTVVLYSNGSTGFIWSESAQISDQAVLQQTDHTFLPPESDQIGAGGKEVWTFKALRPGMSTVYLEYGRPWEGGDKKAWTFNLTVLVE
jgi:inhibitor of cysteine peptidase